MLRKKSEHVNEKLTRSKKIKEWSLSECSLSKIILNWMDDNNVHQVQSRENWSRRRWKAFDEIKW